MNQLQMTILSVTLGLALIEIIWYSIRGKKYDWHEVAASLGVAIGQRVLRAVGFIVLVKFSHSMVNHGGTLKLPAMGAWSWVILFFLNEFTYYWMHRFSHTIRWFWTAHSVHHSAHQLNFFAAIRLGWTGAISGVWLFWFPLVYIGFPVEAVLAVEGIDLLYQFLLHTEMVPKLGFLELFLNTPSHHRVHHARNPIYLDKNFGGVLIIFDRMFGTFTEEQDAVPCEFGLVGRSKTINPFRIALQESYCLMKDAFAARNFTQLKEAFVGAPKKLKVG